MEMTSLAPKLEWIGNTLISSTISLNHKSYEYDYAKILSQFYDRQTLVSCVLFLSPLVFILIVKVWSQSMIVKCGMPWSLKILSMKFIWVNAFNLKGSCTEQKWTYIHGGSILSCWIRVVILWSINHSLWTWFNQSTTMKVIEKVVSSTSYFWEIESPTSSFSL